MNKDRLTLTNIEKAFSSRKILSNVSFSIESGEIVGLLGPNGAGKTTAFYIAAGLIFPSDGKVFINNQEVTNYPMHARAKLGLAYLPQEASIFSDLSVEKNLLGIAELIGGTSEQQFSEVEKVVEEFDLKSILQLKGRMLSGGQRRKVEIARILICKPTIMLLDEPFAGIDPIAVEEIKELLREISKKNISILITDHNVRETLSLCNRAIILNEGCIIAQGSEKSLKGNAHVQQKYFGKMFS
ncbi:LPS export ABC transporter ATP-binding protein [Gammaproteobacteria bacterium]|nr:LPS export ABC transporter ATP-binding protein [Gammaproteobacteria bacterium]